MNTATAGAYQPHFAGRFMLPKMRKSPQNKAFYGHQTTCSGNAHCIKDRVLLDGTCGSGGLYPLWIDIIAELSIRKNYKASYETSNEKKRS